MIIKSRRALGYRPSFGPRSRATVRLAGLSAELWRGACRFAAQTRCSGVLVGLGLWLRYRFLSGGAAIVDALVDLPLRVAHGPWRASRLTTVYARARA